MRSVMILGAAALIAGALPASAEPLADWAAPSERSLIVAQRGAPGGGGGAFARPGGGGGGGGAFRGGGGGGAAFGGGGGFRGGPAMGGFRGGPVGGFRGGPVGGFRGGPVGGFRGGGFVGRGFRGGPVAGAWRGGGWRSGAWHGGPRWHYGHRRFRRGFYPWGVGFGLGYGAYAAAPYYYDDGPMCVRRIRVYDPVRRIVFIRRVVRPCWY